MEGKDNDVSRTRRRACKKSRKTRPEPSQKEARKRRASVMDEQAAPPPSPMQPVADQPGANQPGADQPGASTPPKPNVSRGRRCRTLSVADSSIEPPELVSTRSDVAHPSTSNNTVRSRTYYKRNVVYIPPPVAASTIDRCWRSTTSPRHPVPLHSFTTQQLTMRAPVAYALPQQTEDKTTQTDFRITDNEIKLLSALRKMKKQMSSLYVVLAAGDHIMVLTKQDYINEQDNTTIAAGYNGVVSCTYGRNEYVRNYVLQKLQREVRAAFATYLCTDVICVVINKTTAGRNGSMQSMEVIIYSTPSPNLQRQDQLRETRNETSLNYAQDARTANMSQVLQQRELAQFAARIGFFSQITRNRNWLRNNTGYSRETGTSTGIPYLNNPLLQAIAKYMNSSFLEYWFPRNTQRIQCGRRVLY